MAQEKSVGAEVILVILGLILLVMSMTGKASGILASLLRWLLGAKAAGDMTKKTKDKSNQTNGNSPAPAEAPAPVAVATKAPGKAGAKGTVTVSARSWLGNYSVTEPATMPAANSSWWDSHPIWIDPKTGTRHMSDYQMQQFMQHGAIGELPAGSPQWLADMWGSLKLALH